MQTLLWYRLSGFYFFYFALLGALVPYWSLFLQDKGLLPQQIGMLMAILHASRVIAPNLWGWLADRTGRRLLIVRTGAGLTCLTFAAIFWQQTALGVGLVMAGFSFFWNAVLPQCEVLTLAHLGEQRERYSQIRLWGSIGFIITVVGLGALFDLITVSWLPHICLGIMLLIWVNSLLIPPPPQPPQVKEQGPGFVAQLGQVQVIAFFMVMFLVQLGHGPYYTFYSVMMERLDYSRSEIGLLWAVGVVAEVFVFIFMPRLLKRYGTRLLLQGALLLTTLRWLITAWVPDLAPLMLFAQALHAASFAVVHAVGIALVHHYFATRNHGQAQAFFSSMGFGAGGALGALLSGLLWQSAGPQLTFMLAAITAALGWLLTSALIRPEKAQQN
ncbi:MAG: MFS transporter [Marinobacterium sp.]|nr:MFS transporter [Marinobacterium sp.]